MMMKSDERLFEINAGCKVYLIYLNFELSYLRCINISKSQHDYIL